MGVFQDTNVEWRGQIGKITPKIPGKSGNFPFLALFFHLSLPRIWLTHPNKNYIFETIMDKAFISQRLKIFYTLKDTPNTSEGFRFVAFVILGILGWVYFDPSPSPLVLGGGTKILCTRRVNISCK